MTNESADIPVERPATTGAFLDRLSQQSGLIFTGQLLAEVVHELNNSIGAVLGYSHLLAESEPGDVRLRHLEQLTIAAEWSAETVRRLRTLARPVSDESVLIDVNESLSRALEVMSYSFRMGKIRLDARLAEGLPRVFGRASQIEAAFLNIIDNAHQAMTDAHGEGVLRVRSTLSGVNVQVAIADDGPGIPAESITDVFKPFFTTKSAVDGMGLGLSISRDTIRRHGGQIWLESRAGEGATAYVELPVASSSEPAARIEID